MQWGRRFLTEQFFILSQWEVLLISCFPFIRRRAGCLSAVVHLAFVWYIMYIRFCNYINVCIGFLGVP